MEKNIFGPSFFSLQFLAGLGELFWQGWANYFGRAGRTTKFITCVYLCDRICDKSYYM
jgi:hypothetical protein